MFARSPLSLQVSDTSTLQKSSRTMQESVDSSPDQSPDATNYESVEGRVLRVIATSRRLPLDSITPDSTFEQLGIDSLDRINILFELENEFDISIDDEQAKTIANIPQMVAGIQQLLQANQSGPA